MDLIIENVGRRSNTWAEEGAPTDVGENSLNGFERNVLFWNRGGRQFVDVGYLTGSNLVEDGRGVAVADFDRDGRLDLLVQNLDKPVALLMNRAAGDVGGVANWLEVELEGTASNRDAIGAVVRIETSDDRVQLRQVAAGSGFLASGQRVLHFGLGDASAVERVEVLWPSGVRDELTGVEANQRLAIQESALAAR